MIGAGLVAKLSRVSVCEIGSPSSGRTGRYSGEANGSVGEFAVCQRANKEKYPRVAQTVKRRYHDHAAPRAAVSERLKTS